MDEDEYEDATEVDLDEQVINEVSGAVQRALSNAGDKRMILRSVLVFESMNEDGERMMTLIPSPDSRAWDLYGMAAYLECVAADMMGDLS